MASAGDVAVLIHLQDVPALLVDDESADHERSVVSKPANLGRVSRRDQLALRLLESQDFEGHPIIEGQGVVHVEADGLDGRHAQVSIDVDA